MSSDKTRIILTVALITSLIFILLPAPQKILVANFLGPILLQPVRLGNSLLANYYLLKMKLTSYDERCNQLALENVFMREKLKATNDTTDLTIGDFNLLPTQIIARDLVTMNCFFYLDKGADYDIKRLATVVYIGGLVGKVTQIASHRSTVETILSPGFRVSSVVKRSGVFCMTTASQEGLFANYIQKNGDVLPGDTLMSSGLGDIFPAGINIAVVARLSDGEDMFFKKVYLQPVVDISKLQKVYILSYKSKLPPRKVAREPFRGINPKIPTFSPP